ncbi:serine hydrolase [Anaerospora sp.]|uniref:serine hydrolase n=1 Tax=Anaerospora sp. TaxID=1960278 RepID=UPI00289BBED9|nr:serine hydrolase [Anaerospora sp.]
MRKAIVLVLMLALLAGCGFSKPAPKYPVDSAPKAETKGSQPAVPGPAENEISGPLVDKLHSSAKQFDGKAGIYAKNLQTGQTVSYNENEVFPTASTHKLVVSLAVYKYMYAEASKEKKKQYDQHIKDMLVVSDNPAFYTLLKEIEAEKPAALTQVLTDLGLVKTRIHSEEAFEQYKYHSVTTPREMAIVFERIYREDYVAKEFSTILKEELAHTIYREEIPRFMNHSRVLNKVGALPGVLCDVGLVDDGRDQILISAYTTSDRSEDYASNFLAEISAQAYNALRKKQ